MGWGIERRREASCCPPSPRHSLLMQTLLLCRWIGPGIASLEHGLNLGWQGRASRQQHCLRVVVMPGRPVAVPVESSLAPLYIVLYLALRPWRRCQSKTWGALHCTAQRSSCNHSIEPRLDGACRECACGPLDSQTLEISCIASCCPRQCPDRAPTRLQATTLAPPLCG